MTNNHQTAPPPLGLDTIEQIVTDLLSKYQREEERGNDLERLLTESRNWRDNLNITIHSLKKEYGLADKADSVLGTSDLTLKEEFNGLQSDNTAINTIHLPTVAVSLNKQWEKPKGKSWIDLVKGAIKHYNRLVVTPELIAHLGMDSAAQEKYYNTLTSTLAAYRVSGHIIGVPAYKKTPNGKAVVRYLTGVPEFFQDIETSKLKPEYEILFAESLKKLQLYRSEAEAKRS